MNIAISFQSRYNNSGKQPKAVANRRHDSSLNKHPINNHNDDDPLTDDELSDGVKAARTIIAVPISSISLSAGHCPKRKLTEAELKEFLINNVKDGWIVAAIHAKLPDLQIM